MKTFTYDKKDIPQFKNDQCPKCILKGRCIEENKDDHWFLMCPHYHQWKLGYTSFVSEHLQWEREHPEEAIIKREEQLNKIRIIKEKIKKSKKNKK